MSIKSIRTALDARLKTMGGLPPVAWENTQYVPVQGTLYLAVALMPAAVVNDTVAGVVGQELSMEQGIYQVMVVAPVNVGPGAAAAMAEAVRSLFQRGLSLTYGGVTVRISEKPSVGPALPDADWYRLPVSVTYFSHVFG